MPMFEPEPNGACARPSTDCVTRRLKGKAVGRAESRPYRLCMSAARTRASGEGDAFVKRFRRGNYLATVAGVVGATAIAFTSGSDWSWPFFVWGVGAGVFGVACMRASMWLAYRAAPADEVFRSKQRVRERYRSVYVMTVVLGFCVGAFAASIRSPWPDILFMAFALLSQVPALAMLPRLRREAANSPDA